MLIDAHFHNDDVRLLALQRVNQIQGIVNSDSLAELANSRKTAQSYISFGIHPWKAENVPDNLADVLASVDIIGEIGMDSVWTEVDLAQQRMAFEKQLLVAAQLKKPVILHTKGQEQAILTMIREYPNRYLIHWYSSEAYLAEYLALDTYFTIGPDVMSDEVVQQVAKQVPLDRVLVESDGVGAISWAQQIEISNVDYVATLETSYRYLAKINGVSEATMERTIAANFNRFIHGDLSR